MGDGIDQALKEQNQEDMMDGRQEGVMITVGDVQAGVGRNEKEMGPRV